MKFLTWMVKILSPAITGPVTWLLAGQVFADIAWLPMRFIMQGAAVLLVEGVFLAAWTEVERDDPNTAFPAALTSVVMYGAFLALAIQHGETAAGIIFRLALGLAVFWSTWRTLSSTAATVFSRNAKLARQEARLLRELDSVQLQQRKRCDTDLVLATYKANKEVGLLKIDTERKQKIAALSLQVVETEYATQRKNGGNGNGTHRPTPAVPEPRNGNGTAVHAGN